LNAWLIELAQIVALGRGHGGFGQSSTPIDIEAFTILVDNDLSGGGQDAASVCARRWIEAGREVTRLTPKILGGDFNDIVRGRGAA
jgi:hypothetical protein